MSSPPPDLSLPIIDLANLSTTTQSATTLSDLSSKLHTAFTTTGFAYLTNTPLTLTDHDILTLAHTLFALPHASKMAVAKRTFRPANSNTYRGYFPAQPSPDSLKEGFELGPTTTLPPTLSPLSPHTTINLNEPNIYPPHLPAPARASLETLHRELQALSSTLLSLLATALGQPPSFFAPYLHHSISTLRLLHYPAKKHAEANAAPRFACAPHTDSGLLTLLFQDATGGLEVQSAIVDDDIDGHWTPAPYVPGSIVVNVGDLMGRVSGGEYRATRHRVRSSPEGMDRYSVPFFFEPGAECVVRSVRDEGDRGVRYGEHVLGKMSGWAEFRDGGEGGMVGVESGGEIEVAA